MDTGFSVGSATDFKNVFIWKIQWHRERETEGKEREGEGKREREIFHQVVYSPNSHNSQDWVRLKPAAKDSIWVSHVDGRGWTESGAARTGTIIHMGCWCVKLWLNLPHHSSGPTTVFKKKFPSHPMPLTRSQSFVHLFKKSVAFKKRIRH